MERSMSGTRRVVAILICAALVGGCSPGAPTAQAQKDAPAIPGAAASPQTSARGSAPKSPTPSSKSIPNKVTTIARGLEHPWAIEFLPDGRALITERPGRLRILGRDGKLSSPLTGVPSRIQARGQGGLLDVAIDPGFARNRTIYLTFSEADESGNAGTALARAQLGSGGLEGTEVIWRQQPKVRGAGHFGSRIVFAKDGTLWIGLGERMSYSDQAQELSSALGKVVRLNADGSIPKDNPFVNRQGAKPEIWSYGHRNIQAAAMHPRTGELWTIEHGPRGGDELNRTLPGRNYGWPIITYGREYSGRKVGEGISQREGMQQPGYFWDPVIAPSGMIFYTGNAYPKWKNSIFVGSLAPGALVRLELAGNRVAREERYLGELGERIRDVTQSPDGLIYFVTDERDGRVGRIER